MKSSRAHAPVLFSLMAVLLMGVFAVDLVTPLGFTIWIFFIAPVVLGVFTHRPLAPLLAGLIAGAMVVLGYFLSPPSPVAGLSHLSLINRGFGCVSLWALALLGRQFVVIRRRMEAQDWVKQGHNGLSAKLQGELSLGELGRNVLSYLARYLAAPIGTAWVTQQGALFKVASFAGAVSSDPSPERLAPGQTLIGQAAAEGRVLVIEDLPEGYATISSSLGAAPPRVLILVPLGVDGDVRGVLELGFFRMPPAPARELLEGIGEACGVALRSAEHRARKTELLEQTRRQAEELEEQRRSLMESQLRLESQQAELEEYNTQLAEQTRTLEEQKERLLDTQGLLERKASDLQRASVYKSEFLANMSHELRTPLNSALLLARLLSDNRPGNLLPEQIKYAQSISQSGNELLRMINDILDLSKIESGKLELANEPVALTELFAGLVRCFEPLAKEKGLALSMSLEPGCPGTLLTDGRRLGQVLTNLLSNALKFTERGSVSLSAGLNPSGEIALSVEDTGIGIAPQQQQAVFEAFRQADGSINRKYGGTGLGLSISRELTTALGGKLTLESEPGQGSCFTLTLPMRAAVAPAPPREHRSAQREAARVILAIEDSPAGAAPSGFDRVFEKLLQELDLECVIAHGADEGLTLARRLKPAAILLYQGAPNATGAHAALELLKEDPELRHVPVHVVALNDAGGVGATGYALELVQHPTPASPREALVEPEALSSALHRLEAQLARKVKTVLVVEDDPTQREGITQLLQADGVQLTAVGTAEEGLEQLRARTFDCLVLDLNLPGTSGFELLGRLGDGGAAFPPVIVYTARSLTPAEEHQLRRRAASVIIKGTRSPERLREEVSLFLHQVEAELPAQAKRPPQAALNREAFLEGRRILLVEDDVRNVFALTSSLEPTGARVELARNGKEAVARMKTEPAVDLVLMDLMMPEMDGLSATREIRKDARFAALPIIALTAKAMPDDRKQCLEAGANDYIAKPIDLDKLLSLVRVWMPRVRPPAAGLGAR